MQMGLFRTLGDRLGDTTDVMRGIAGYVPFGPYYPWAMCAFNEPNQKPSRSFTEKVPVRIMLFRRCRFGFDVLSNLYLYIFDLVFPIEQLTWLTL